MGVGAPNPAIAKLKAAGVPIVTAGGEPVALGAAKIAIVRDPNNLMLELIQAPRK